MTSPFLPENLIFEILSRLSARNLLQLKCVCKSWKTLISDPNFAMTQLRISNAESTLTHQRLAFSVWTEPPYKIVSYPVEPLFQNPSTVVKPVTLSGMMKHEYFIIGSCNGLLCLFDFSQRCFRLFNPLLKLKSKKSQKVVSLDWVILYYGFGYDHVNDKYKVLVAVQNKYDTSEILTKIFTFGEDSWKTIQNFTCTPTMRLGKYVSSTLNWIVDKTGRCSHILSFDLEKETYGEVLLPQDVHGCRPMLYVLSNCLCVFADNVRSTTNFQWAVWLMKEYGVAKSWTKLIINTHDQLRVGVSSYINPVFISENGVVLLVNKDSSKLIIYYSNSGALDYRTINSTLGFDLHVYRESLVSPRW